MFFREDFLGVEVAVGTKADVGEGDEAGEEAEAVVVAVEELAVAVAVAVVDEEGAGR